MSVEPLSVQAPALLRLQVTAVADPVTIPNILERFVRLNVLPKRFFATLCSAGTLRIEVDTADLEPRTLDLIAAKLHDVPRVLCAHWYQVAAQAKHARNTCSGTTELSERERQILREVSFGHSDKVIARNLALSAPTVNFHLRSIFRKLKVHKRACAVTEARGRGWIP